ncbi:Smr/MutS family protein [Rhodalgimonas zhirmunskyi]|uniref:Smr/MutS family protein n=1 Tax=Rhodalgimonas zhirmunskyi TaxID=2964767 RepID=A0AAJ1U7D8_9RHOB|nr:Smr/MutS family protein [Rhodoalgimonas zhirmunskyi]MDQ2094319.1 Smr/MutS family protein [Rhodoalgimonas zhirmunskyi]
MTRRRLSEDEIALWRRVAETTEKMHRDGKPHEAPIPRPKPKPQPRQPGFRLEPFDIPAKPADGGHDVLPPIGERLAKAPLRMDRKAHQKLKRGKMVPEAKLDLHGMTMERAHPRLLSFILQAHGQGKRLVLVITGKGKHRDEGGPIPVRHGVLRHQVPHWLSVPPLAQVVLQVAEAHQSHGGGGAYYVYLRRSR